MSTLTKSITTCLAILTLSVTTSQANADSYRHIQQLALDIQLKADRLMGETHHYVHTPNYRTMVRAVSELRSRAVKVHVLSIQHGCLDAMSAHLNQLDALFHSVEGLFDATEIQAGYGHGHVHGATDHVKEFLNAIEDCIHHIQSDIASLRRPVYKVPVYRPAYSGHSGYYGTGNRYGSGYGSGCRSEYRSHPRSRVQHDDRHGHGRVQVRSGRGGGISYGNDKFNIRIGF